MGCYDPKEACLDLLSNNYDVSADDGCENCCTYPSIKLSVKHQWKDKTISFNDTLWNDVRSTFVLLDHRVLLSNFNYQTNSGKTISTLDSNEFDIGVLKQPYTFKNGLAYIIKSQSNVNVDRCRSDFDEINAYSFQLGVDDLLDSLTIEQAQNIENLNQDNGMYNSNKYATHYIKLAVNDTFTDTISYFGTLKSSYNINHSAEVNVGEDVVLPLTIDYYQLFSSIDFSNHSSSLIFERIEFNATKSFY